MSTHVFTIRMDPTISGTWHTISFTATSTRLWSDRVPAISGPNNRIWYIILLLPCFIIIHVSLTFNLKQNRLQPFHLRLCKWQEKSFNLCWQFSSENNMIPEASLTTSKLDFTYIYCKSSSKDSNFEYGLHIHTYIDYIL